MTRETLRKPDWLKTPLASGEDYANIQEIKNLMRGQTLHTVCEEAKCPNLHECWANKTATFMILGETCTRACRFCAVHSGIPSELDMEEPNRVANAAELMGLQHCVITSVARDDLADGGASIFAASIQAVRNRLPHCHVEVLIPDFLGDERALCAVLDANPDVLNHNVETVRRLTDTVRSKATYDRSIALLKRSKQYKPNIPTKTSLMVGIGETWEELIEVMDDLRAVDCDILTIGQYMQPTAKHMRIDSFYTPEQFFQLKEMALARGFSHVESGPLVRSSYHAKEQKQAADRTIKSRR
jgi:lipoic acid synthetase